MAFSLAGPILANISTSRTKQGHYVLVTRNSRIPIQGIGTVDCNLSEHEVLLRKVYHDPDLNTPHYSQSGPIAAAHLAAPEWLATWEAGLSSLA
jgi:hypothetical protein